MSPDLAQTMGLGGDNMTAILVVFTNAGRQTNWLDSSVVGSTPLDFEASEDLSLKAPRTWMCPYK